MMNMLGTPEIEPKLHWNNSSNVLCNYMKEPEYLEMILKNQAIIPRYVIEPLDYLNIQNLQKIAFPMTCFCDIPFTKVGNHMTSYGRYGIALSKQEIIQKFKVQPIHYMNPQSPLVADFKEAFVSYYRSERRVHQEDQVLLDYILSTLLYMKPISKIEIIDGTSRPYIFQDECEWRYIPTDGFPSSIPLLMKEDQITEKGKNAYSHVLEEHPETWIKYDWEDVRYIIVPDEPALERIINVIRQLPIGDVIKYMLSSRIEISNRFTEDLL